MKVNLYTLDKTQYNILSGRENWLDEEQSIEIPDELFEDFMKTKKEWYEIQEKLSNLMKSKWEE